jgi:hypothetical protein
MTLQILIGAVVVLWLTGIAASLCAFGWGCLAVRRRFWLAVILSVVALVISYLGLTHFSFAYSRTVNGKVISSLSSKWFFMTSLLLGALALAGAVLKKWKSAGVAYEQRTNQRPA